jgi:hypothetical protein
MAKTQSLYANNARTNLGGDITAVAVSFTVGSVAGFPTISTAGQYFYVTLDDLVHIEIVKVTSVAGSTFTVVRGQEGTTASAFTAATPTVVSHRLTAADLTNFARIDDHMGALGSITGLGLPSTMNGNSYVLGDNSADNTYVTAIANTGLDLWSFTTYPAQMYSGTVGAGATTTVINLATATTLLPDQSSLAYIIQLTSGSQKGQARFVSAISSSTITVNAAFSSAPGNTDTYAVYQHVGSNTLTYNNQRATLLDPAYVTPTTNPILGAKRLTTGNFQMYDGAAWNAYPLNYIPSTAAVVGSFNITGSAGGYAGLDFTAAFHGQSVLASTTAKQSGVYSAADSTWDWRWDAGVLTVGTVPYASVSGTPNLAVYAPINNPTFTGVPAAPTAAAGTNTTQIATTAFVRGSEVFTGNATSGTRTNTASGIIEQWFESFQSAAGGGIVSISYPVAFATSAAKPFVSLYDNNLGGLGASNFVNASVVSSSLTGCTVNIGQNGGGTRDVTLSINVRGT